MWRELIILTIKLNNPCMQNNQSVLYMDGTQLACQKSQCDPLAQR